MQRIKVVLGSLLLVPLFLWGCAGVSDLPRHRRTGGQAIQGHDFVLWAPCERQLAEGLATAGQKDGWAAIRAANCFAALVRQGEDKSQRLADAKRGRRLAQAAVAMLPRSGLAHYLAAYLTGMEAENDPLRGLALVPLIEREAMIASDLDPGIDHGGPDRMLGELYLHAPGIPISIGDSAKAVDRFRRALDHDPEFPENRLGLVEALLAEEELGRACFELKGVLSEMAPDDTVNLRWKKTIELLDRLCSLQEPE